MSRGVCVPNLPIPPEQVAAGEDRGAGSVEQTTKIKPPDRTHLRHPKIRRQDKVADTYSVLQITVSIRLDRITHLDYISSATNDTLEPRRGVREHFQKLVADRHGNLGPVAHVVFYKNLRLGNPGILVMIAQIPRRVAVVQQPDLPVRRVR